MLIKRELCYRIRVLPTPRYLSADRKVFRGHDANRGQPADLRDDPHRAEGAGRRDGHVPWHGALLLRPLHSLLGDLH